MPQTSNLGKHLLPKSNVVSVGSAFKGMQKVNSSGDTTNHPHLVVPLIVLPNKGLLLKTFIVSGSERTFTFRVHLLPALNFCGPCRNNQLQNEHHLFFYNIGISVIYITEVNPKFKFITPPARRAWRSYKFAPFLFFSFFPVSKVGAPLMGDTAVHCCLSHDF